MNQRILDRVAAASREYDQWPESFKNAFRLSTIVDRIPPTIQEGVALIAEIDRLGAEVERLQSQIDHPAAVILELRAEIAVLRYERDKWQANHADMKRRNAFLLQRPDLDVTRLPVYEQMTADLAAANSLRAEAEGEVNRQSNRIAELETEEASWLPQYQGLRADLERAEGEVERLKGDCEVLRENFTHFRYSHSEIEAACGGAVALGVREKVMVRRAKIELTAIPTKEPM